MQNQNEIFNPQLVENVVRALNTGEFTVAEGAVGRGVRRTLRAVFDVAALGGSVIAGAHGSGLHLPVGGQIIRSFYKVLQTFTSATDAATIAVGLNTGVDVKAAIAISNVANPWDAGAVAAGIQDNAIANILSLTAERELMFTTAVETLTAGKMVWWLEYVVA